MVSVQVNMRLGKKLLKEVDTAVKSSSYESRTELVKDALRDKLSDIRKQELVESARTKQGEGKRLGIKDPTPEEFRRVRDELGKELLKKHGLK